MDKRWTERSEPVPTLTPVLGVLLLSIGSGAVVFLGIGAVALAARAPVSVPLSFAGLAMLAVWLTWVTRVTFVYWTSETSKPAAVDSEPVAMPMMSVEVVEPASNRIGYLDLPGSPVALASMARGLLAGRPFSESEWSGGGAPYSRRAFRALRAELMERGLVRWRDAGAPTQGVELSPVGRAVLREVARTSVHVRQDGARVLTDGAG